MEVEDLIGIAAHNLWIHVPQSARDRFFIILVRELLRANRMAQEEARVSDEADLSQKIPYAVKELEDRPEETADYGLAHAFHALPQEEQENALKRYKILRNYAIEELSD